MKIVRDAALFPDAPGGRSSRQRFLYRVVAFRSRFALRLAPSAPFARAREIKVPFVIRRFD